MVTLSDLDTPSSGDSTIDALLSDGPLWNYLLPEQTTLTYAFAEGDVDSPNSSYVESEMTADQKAATEDILDHVTEVTGILFSEIDDPLTADIVFAGAQLSAGTAGLTVWNSSLLYMDDPSTDDDEVTEYAVDTFIYVDTDDADYSDQMDPGEYGYLVILHEMGHALGLKHPGQYESGDVGPYLPESEDNTDNTVMSYNDGEGGYPSEFQDYDIMALNFLYGGDGLGGESGAVAEPPVYVITATDADHDEGDSGTTDFTFTVTRSGDTSADAILDYQVVGSGSNPADFVDFYGEDAVVPTVLPQVTFDAGTSSATITVSIVADTTAEYDETFTVSLLDPDYGSLDAESSAVGTIRNDDGDPDETQDQDDTADDDTDDTTDDGANDDDADDGAGDDTTDDTTDDDTDDDGADGDSGGGTTGTDDTVNVQRGTVGKGGGDDTYIIATALVDDNAEVTISDGSGDNILQFITGLTITGSAVASNTLQLTLSDGASLTILDAADFTYVLGGDPLAGTLGDEQTFAAFVTDTLGYDAVPTTESLSSDVDITIA